MPELATLRDARLAFNASPKAHLFDYVTDCTTRQAMELRQYGAGGGDAAEFFQAAVGEGAPVLVVPNGAALRSSVQLSHMQIRGEAFHPGALHPYGSRGSVIELWSQPGPQFTSGTPFLCGPNVSFSELQFYWPEQLDNPAGPKPFAPLIANQAAPVNMTGLDLHRVTAVNAYDLIAAGGNEEFNKAGQWLVEASRLNALRWLFNVNHMPDFTVIGDTAVGWNLFADEMLHYSGGGAGAPNGFYLRAFAEQNAVIWRVWGNGQSGQMATRSVDGIATGNLHVYGPRTVLLIDGGRVTNTTLDGIFDGAGQLVKIINHGACADLHAHARAGSYFYKHSAPDAATPPMIEAVDPEFCTITVTGEPVTAGELVQISGPNVSDIDVRVNCRAFARTTDAGVYHAIDIDTPNATVSVDARLRADAPQSGQVQRSGVRIAGARGSRVRVQSENCWTPIEIATTAGRHLVEGCETHETGGASSLVVANGANVRVSGCNFDKPNPAVQWPCIDGVQNVAQPLTSDTPKNVAYVDLAAGTWDVSLAPRFTGDAATLAGYVIASISLSATPALDLSQGRCAVIAPGNTPFAWCGMITPNVNAARLTLAAPTRVYFSAQAGFSGGAMNVHGQISARLLA